MIYSLFSTLSAFLPDQEVPTTIFVNTLNDYDIALRALFQESKLNENVYKRLEEKIKEAISNINSAKTEEEAKSLYEDIVEEIKSKTSKTETELEKRATEEKVKKAQQEELAKAILNRFKALATEQGLSNELNPHINEALKNIENARTAKDVDNELADFRSLLNANTYGNLKDKFDAQEKFLKTQEEAIAKLDAYESALDAIQDSDAKSAIEDALKLAREEIMAAEEEGRITNIMNNFETKVVAKYPTAKTAVSKKLVSDALANGIKQLEAYKTGAYAEEIFVEGSDNKTIKQLADEKITDLQNSANTLLQSSSITTESYKEVNTKLQTSVKAIDDEIEKIKDKMRENQEAYLKAYEVALEELGIYEANAEKYGLTGEALEYVKSEVSAVKAKIASVDTEGEVNEAMRLFRNGIKQYSPEFDAYQVTETRKAVKEALEEYKELNNSTITNNVNTATAQLESAGTVDAIKKIERDTIKIIEQEIKKDELASSKLEARKEFLVFIEDNSDKYNAEVRKLASEAISKISEAYSVADVETQVAKYKALIDNELKEYNTSMQALIKEEREKALKEIAIYEEIATTAKDTGTLNRIATAKSAIASNDVTIQSIRTTKNNLIRDIEALGLPIVSAKVEAIDFLKGIGTNYYTNTNGNSEINSYLLSNGQLSYEKLIKDEYINGQFEKAFNMIKDARDEAAVEVQKTGKVSSSENESYGGGIKTARGIIVKAVKQDLAKMEQARSKALSDLGELLTDVKAKKELEDIYKAEINAVDMNKYMNDSNIFDEILAKATTAKENHVKDLIKSEAQENLNVENVNSAIESKKDSIEEFSETEISDIQENVSITTNSNGEGKVTGTLHKLKEDDDFTKNFTQKEGYYLVLSFTSETAKTIKYQRLDSKGANQGNGTLDEDRILVIWFADEDALEDTKIVISFCGENGEVIETITISDFSELILEAQPN